MGVNDDSVGGGRVELRYEPFDDLTIDVNFTSQAETSDGSSRWTPPGVAAFAGDPNQADQWLRSVQHRGHPQSLERQSAGFRVHRSL